MRRLPPCPRFQRIPQRQPAEFVATFGDIEMMARLGKYYAAKIRGATELALYRATRDQRHRELAVQHLTAAAEFWKAYGNRVSTAYGSVLDQSRGPGRLAGTGA